MATLLRLVARKTTEIYVNRVFNHTKFGQPCCFISTSKKNKESLTVRPDSTTPLEETEEFKRLKEHFADWDPEKSKNWVSYGFDFTDRDMDTFMKNMVMFLIVSCMFVAAMTFVMYTPDVRLKNWAWREAFLELERREREGLPLVDPNLVNPDTVVLPSEEEIGDQDIII
ncbi:NADH dehydrogenase [ubiquinone] 1 beta subcomplex subunit 11, mitochondrial-like [Mytilus galloprovincialis]|uniref:NADH dehydrogenase [ubiquinone] 1 beta subcomplex subunit 11, mitochondrial n=1 Tax=Mytilus galloprovincialis TaxID=29158 RepID=A0A8B6FWT9_MYTGA|nr:NADH dehydrogenase (ubiquinone) 1 beta subcomplex subunit 11 [Mytilus galloprovincialis]